MSNIVSINSSSTLNLPDKKITHPDELKKNRVHFSDLELKIHPKSSSKTTVILPFESVFCGKVREDGSIIWRSADPITAKDVIVLAEHLVKFNQSIHINTGTHGTKDGLNAYESKSSILSEGVFLQEDIEDICLKYNNVSFQVVGTLSSHIYPKGADHVIDAWCNGAKNVVLGPGIYNGGYVMCTAAGMYGITPTSSLLEVVKLATGQLGVDGLFSDVDNTGSGFCKII